MFNGHNISRLLLVLFVLCLSSCREEGVKESKGQSSTEEKEVLSPEQFDGEEMQYDPSTTDEALSARISELLREMFREDLPGMADVDRRFQMYKINLDTDSSDEVFVRFMSPYFCGSGGCTFLLLDDDLSLITRFTVTRAPFFVEQTLENNWKMIMLRSEGEWKLLTNKGDGYPGNPTVLPKAPYDAPSANAVLVFGDMTSGLPDMTYGF